MPPIPQTPAGRQPARLKRKRRLALAQADQFEDTLSGHELNIARLNAIPEADRAEDHDDLLERELEAKATLERSITTTLNEVAALEAGGVTE